MTESKPAKIGGLLLAAGGSTRLGRPKQFIEYNGETLLRRAAKAVSASGCSVVVVVLGASADQAQAKIHDLHVHSVVNPDWRSGMSSSIRTGLAELLKLEPIMDAVLITLMDQPLVNAKHLARFVERFSVDRPAVFAAEYQGIAGVPALFSRELFDELFKLEGDSGARSVIRGRPDILTISLGDAATDIDTLSDVEGLRQS